MSFLRWPFGRRAKARIVEDAMLNVYSFEQMTRSEPAFFAALRFDPNNTCNLQCVYCHNPRSSETIALDRFTSFLHQKVLGANFFQVGCVMEPTLDPRLTAFLLAIAASPAPPDTLMLQTNGTLLHKHDYSAMREACLAKLCVSLDTADPQIQKDLRDGLSLRRVLANIKSFSLACPQAALEFVCTVTSSNVDQAPSLVHLGLDVGVRSFIFREMFYHRTSRIVDHARMPALQLAEGRFLRLRDNILCAFAGQAAFTFATAEGLDVSGRGMMENSGVEDRDIRARGA
jgi:MoaA/NifB/PqqE/SkfB family radical SAM enzyme